MSVFVLLRWQHILSFMLSCGKLIHGNKTCFHHYFLKFYLQCELHIHNSTKLRKKKKKKVNMLTIMTITNRSGLPPQSICFNNLQLYSVINND
jgi:hypothetical protein